MRVRLRMLRSALATRWRESARTEPTVNRHRDARDESRLIGREERRERTNLFRLSVAPERMHDAGAPPHELRRAGGNRVGVLRDRRFDHTGTDRHASNLVTREVERDSLRHDHDAALRGLVGAKIRHALDT